MRLSEFNKLLKRQQYGVELLINLDDLEVYHPKNNKRIVLVKDPRSYQENGIWQLYPIAIIRKLIYIVCPYCGEIHSHGDEEGTRIPHCHCNKPDYNILRKEG